MPEDKQEEEPKTEPEVVSGRVGTECPPSLEEKTYKYYGLEYRFSVAEMAAQSFRISTNHKNILGTTGNGVSGSH